MHRWPGITTFGYDFADMHGHRQPAWESYKGYLDFLKHTQYVLQSGIAKVDVAIYRKDYDITFQAIKTLDVAFLPI